jgi:oxygen-dependent protoporphyrinogen oxidase
MTRVGIVGAGITGLALSHHLAERGVDSIAFEATDRPGGVIRTGHVDDAVLEWGPQRLRLTDPIGKLVDAAGIGDEVIHADPDLSTYVYADGRLGEVPLSVGAFLRTDLLSLRGKLRILAEPLTPPGRPEESAAGLFTRKFGREAYENAIGPLFGGIYASDPAAMPARHALEGVLRLESASGSLLRAALERVRGDRAPAASFEDGLGRLPAALADRHENRIRVETPVESVDRTGDADDDGRYRIETADGTERVDHVVLTTPANVTADLLAGLAPDSADALATLNYNPLAMVYLRSDVDARGLGYQVRRGEDLHTLGVTWNASAFDRDGVYTVFLGGMDEPELVDRPDAELEDIARREFEAVMDAGAEPIAVNRWERGFPAYDHTWGALDRVSLPDRVHLATNYTARVGVPSRAREAEGLAERLAGG